MKPFAPLALIALLAACGADGAPEAPATQAATESGITIGGCVKAGVTMGAPSTGGPVRC